MARNFRSLIIVRRAIIMIYTVEFRHQVREHLQNFSVEVNVLPYFFSPLLKFAANVIIRRIYTFSQSIGIDHSNFSNIEFRCRWASFFFSELVMYLCFLLHSTRFRMLSEPYRYNRALRALKAQAPIKGRRAWLRIKVQKVRRIN